MKTIGVYEIWISDYFYHGSSIDCEARCESHFKELKRGNHTNRKMQDAYDKYKSFDYQIVIECDNRDVAYVYEQDFIDTHFGLDKCLNRSNKAIGGPTIKIEKQNKFKRIRHSHGNLGKQLPKSQCHHCLGLFTAGTLSRWHGDNCKKKLQQVENNPEISQDTEYIRLSVQS